MRKILFKLWMMWLMLAKPNAGYYEKLCLAAGHTTEEINQWMEEEIFSDSTREEVCKLEVYYWRYS